MGVSSHFWYQRETFVFIIVVIIIIQLLGNPSAPGIAHSTSMHYFIESSQHSLGVCTTSTHTMQSRNKDSKTDIRSQNGMHKGMNLRW